MNRRDFLRFLLATPLAATVDVEALIWVPKPIVVVPAIPCMNIPNMGQIVATAWEEYVGTVPVDNVVDHFWLLERLK